MNEFLLSLATEEKWRDSAWLGSWVCGGSPLRDPSCELLFKQGLPGFRTALFVNWGCGAWMNLLTKAHGRAQAVHIHREDEVLFNENRTRLHMEERVDGYFWLPGDVVPDAWANVDVVFVRMWKEMDYNLAWFGALAHALPKGCEIHFLGHKEEGIRNLENRLSSFGRVDTLSIGCHSRWLALESVRLDGATFPEIESGLFGAGNMDAGTRLLLEHAGSVQGQSVCDLGCGSGEISAWALKNGATHVYATDHQHLAAVLASKRLVNSESPCTVGCHFIGEGIPESFDCILTNPPFHLQSHTRFAIGSVWLKAAKKLLAPEGRIRLVCNEFLDYPRFAMENGLKLKELARRGGFRVYEFSL